MASHSLQSLLAWMKDTSRLQGWDAMLVLSAEDINNGLLETYAHHLSQSGEQRMPAGSFIVEDSPVSYAFQDVIVGAPTLLFDATSLERSDQHARLPIISGREVILRASSAGSAIQRMAVYDPLTGPYLEVGLQLATDSRSVALDLTRSDDVVLMIDNSSTTQRAAGRFFKEQWLQNTDNQQRTFGLVAFPEQGNPFMATRRIDVRSQSDDPSAAKARKALVLFITMQHGATGSFPNDDSAEFRYLIPNDVAPQFSATALFSAHLLHRAALGHAVLQMLGNPPFDYSTASSGLLSQMAARGGEVKVAGTHYKTATYEFESEAFSISAVSGVEPLAVAFDVEQAVQRWSFPCEVSFKYKAQQSSAWQERTATFTVTLEHEFHLTADDTAVSGMEGHLFIPYSLTGEVQYNSGLPADTTPAELVEINGFIANTLKRSLFEAFASNLNIAAPDVFLTQTEVATGHCMQASTAALPYDLAQFGQAIETPTAFRIVEQHLLLGAGAQQPFTTEPVIAGLLWSIESLPNSSGDPGRINAQNGLYRAPPAHAMHGLFSREWVVATDPQTDIKSSALVTILASHLTVSPVIQVCNHSEQIEFSVAALGSELPQWSIKNPIPGESGTLVPSTQPGGKQTYIAHAKVPEKTLVLDEIQVTQADQITSAYALVLNSAPDLTLRPVEQAGLPAGQAQLVAMMGSRKVDAQWCVLIESTGAITSTGVFTEDPTNKAIFTVITAQFDSEDLGLLEGYIILPLPLASSAEVIARLAQKP